MGKIVMGLDIGYGGLKVVVAGADYRVPKLGQGLYVKRATAAPADRVNSRLKGGEDGYDVYVGTERFLTCYDPIRVVSTARNLNADYHRTQEYLALFYTALVLSGHRVIDKLVTGLPVVHFKNPETRKALVDLMKGVHEVRPGVHVQVNDVEVLAQPFGGFVAYAYDYEAYEKDPEFKPDEATIVIIDPGTFSVDWSVFARMTALSDLNNSSTKASHVMLENMASAIGEDHGVDVAVTDIESCIIRGDGSMLAGGKRISIEPYLERVKKEIVPDVVGTVIAKVRQMGRSPDRVVLVGGGAPFYDGMVAEKYGKDIVRTLEDPVAANARGFYFYGCQQVAEG